MFAKPNTTLAEAWLCAGAYTILLFFDFAGYSAMAIGLGLMIGFRFIENFNAPYRSQSITEFWRRWHISLSHWLRDYLYLPLGGNRRGAVRTYVNLMLTMVLGGLWHGANWTFILWGAWHGGWLAVERALGAKSAVSVWPKGLAWIFTMLIVMVGWVMFRAESVGQAVNIYAGMLGGHGWGLTAEFAWQLQNSELAVLCVGFVLSVFGNDLLRGAERVPTMLRLSSQIALLGIACLALVAQTHSPFLYFQF